MMSLFLFLFFLLSLFFSFFFPPKKLSSVAIHIVFLSWFLSFKIFFLLHSRWWYSVSCFLNPCSVSHFSDCHSTTLFFCISNPCPFAISLSFSLYLFLNLFTLASLFLSRAFFFICSLPLFCFHVFLFIVYYSLGSPHPLDNYPFSQWPSPSWSLSILLVTLTPLIIVHFSPPLPRSSFFQYLAFHILPFFFHFSLSLTREFSFSFQFKLKNSLLFFFFHFHLPSFYRTN